MSEKSKPNEDKPQEPTEEIKEESVKEPQLKSEEQAKGLSTKPIEESEEVIEKKEKQPIDKQKKTEAKEEKPKKKVEHKDDFKYIVRIANTDLDGEKTLVHGLTSIKGIGMHMSVLIADSTGINRNIKIGDLKDTQIEKIKETLDNLNKNVPGWMVNHRKDLDSGDDLHLIGSDIDMQLRDEINVMKKIRSYKGVRHEQGLPVRGQRTRANNRKGLSLGVSKKRVQLAAKSSSKE